MTFDRFDVVVAYRMYAVLWGGDGRDYQNGILTRIARLDFKPGSSEEHLCGLSANARDIYDALVQRRHGTGYVPCACVTCFEVAIGVNGTALCHGCEEAGCEPGCGECPACLGRECERNDLELEEENHEAHQ